MWRILPATSYVCIQAIEDGEHVTKHVSRQRGDMGDTVDMPEVAICGRSMQ